MPSYGVSTRTVAEGRAQLLFGAIIAALFVVLYLGQNLSGVPTPLGVNLGDATNLAIDALWVAFIAWATVSPPAGRNVWLLASYIVFFPLMHVLTDRHAAVAIATSDVIVAVAGTLGGLSIITRRLWGAK